MNATNDSSVGNVAAMREALTKISESATYALKYRREGLDYGDLQGFIEEMGEDARAALSAPARNCDKMPDIDNLTMHDLANSPCKSTLAYASREELLALVRWLLAPAEERKGEGDGR